MDSVRRFRSLYKRRRNQGMTESYNDSREQQQAASLVNTFMPDLTVEPRQSFGEQDDDSFGNRSPEPATFGRPVKNHKLMYEIANQHAMHLVDQLHLARKDFAESDKHLAVEQDTVKELQRTLDIRDRQASAAADIREQHVSEIATLSAQLEATNSRLSDAQQQREALEKVSGSLHAKYSKTKDMLSTVKETLRDAAVNAEQAEAAHHEVDRLKAELQSHRANEESSRRERHVLRRQCEKHEKDIEILRQNLESAKKEINESNIKLSNRSKEIAAVTQERDAAQALLTRVKNELHDSLNSSTTIQSQLESDLTIVRQELAQTKQKWASVVEIRREQDCTIRNLREALQDAQSRLTQSHASLEEFQQYKNTAEAENTTLTANYNELRADLETSQQQHSRETTLLTSELTAAQKTMLQLTESHVTAIRQVERLQNLNEILLSQTRAFDTTTSHLQSEAETARSQEAALAKRLEHLQSLVQSLEAAKKNLLQQQQSIAEEGNRRIATVERAAAAQHLSDLEELATLRSANQMLNIKVEELVQDQSRHSDSSLDLVNDLQQQLSATNRLHSHLLLENAKFHDALTDAEKVLTERDAEIVAATENAKIGNTVSETLRGRLALSDDNLQEARRRLSISNTQVLQGQIALGNLQHALSTARQEKGALESAWKNSKTDLIDFENRLQLVQNENLTLQKEIERLISSETENAVLQEQMEKAEHNLANLRTVHNVLEVAFQATREELAKEQSTSQNLSATCETLQAELGELDKVQSAMRELEGAHTASTQQLADLEPKYAEAILRMQHLNQIESEYRQLSQEATQTLTEKEDLSKRLSEIEHAHAQLLSEKEEMQTVKAKLGNECFVLERALEDLKGKFETMQAAWERTNQSLAKEDEQQQRLIKLVEIANKVLALYYAATKRDEKTEPVASGSQSIPQPPLDQLENLLEKIQNQAAYLEIAYAQMQRSRLAGVSIEDPRISRASNTLRASTPPFRDYRDSGTFNRPLWEINDWSQPQRNAAPWQLGWNQPSRQRSYESPSNASGQLTLLDDENQLSDWQSLQRSWGIPPR